MYDFVFFSFQTRNKRKEFPKTNETIFYVQAVVEYLKRKEMHVFPASFKMNSLLDINILLHLVIDINVLLNFTGEGQQRQKNGCGQVYVVLQCHEDC